MNPMEVIRKEYQPSISLQHIVDCYWTAEFHGAPGEISPLQRCYPLGMTELIVHLYGNPSGGILQNRWRIFPEAFMVGIMKAPVDWHMFGPSAMFGIRFKPEGVIQLFKSTLADLANAYVDATSFLGREHTPIIERLQEAPDNKARIFVIETFLHNQLAKFNPEKNYFTEAVKRIRNSNGSFTHEVLSDNFFVCERQLQRLFKTNFGMSPKSYARIMRFRSAYDQVKSCKEVEWSDLAYTLGYTDQAHFIHDFKEYSGSTPKSFKSLALATV